MKISVWYRLDPSYHVLHRLSVKYLPMSLIVSYQFFTKVRPDGRQVELSSIERDGEKQIEVRLLQMTVDGP